MSGPLRDARALLQDAERALLAAARQAEQDWDDAAQRQFWVRTVSQLQRETQQYTAAFAELEQQLVRAVALATS